MFAMFLHLILLYPVEAEVPKVTLSPDSIADATNITAKIKKVVLYGDRAVVHRNNTKTLSAGTHTLRFPNLSSTVAPDSIRLNMTGATLLRLDTRLVDTETYSLENINEMVNKLESLDIEIQRLLLKRFSYAQELKILQQSTPNGFVEDDYKSNVAQYSLQLWKQNWQFMRTKMEAIQKELQSIDSEIKEKRKVYDALLKESEPLLEGNISKTTLEVVAVVEVKKGQKIAMDLTYTVEGARWTPVYDVHYDSKTDEARVESAAMVVQNSGEDWENVILEFATSNRRAYKSLPNLLTWTLGEKNEYIPQARPANSRPTTPLYPPFASQRSQSELDTMNNRMTYVSQRDRLAELSQHLNGMLNIADQHALDQTPAVNIVGILGSKGVQAGSSGLSGNISGLGKRSSAPHSPRYVERTEIDFEAIEIYDEELAQPQGALLMESTAGAIDRSVGMQSTARSGRAYRSKKESFAEPDIQVANIPLALEASNLYAPIRYHNNQFNISEAQSLNLLWKAPGRFTIPNDGQQHRIPLQSISHSATSFYEATPSLEEIAYLKGAVQNTDSQAILQGNANIFLNGHYTVQSRLNTTKAGGLLEIPLGADENIRIKRNITPMQRKEGILKQQDITDYSVKIEIGNYKQNSISIRILDQLPITKNDEITIDYLESSHPFEQQNNHQGILYWDLEIPAGKTETIELNYSISRPKNWKLWGN